MTSLESVWQPSVLDLARSGNFRALTYWINSYLLPQGIQARVETTGSGCLQIWVELRQTPERERLVQSICHLIWRLNSDVIDGVKIVARLAGQPDILWKQSVRIVTPANRQRKHQFPAILSLVQEAGDSVNFKVLRSMLVLGTALTSFVMGCWLSYRFIVAHPMATPTPLDKTETLSQPTRPKQVQAALETVDVKYPSPVTNPQDPVVTLMFAGDLSLSDSLATAGDPDYQWTFGPMDLAKNVDLALMNLENSVTYPEIEGTDLQPRQKMLQRGGIDVVNVASYTALPSSDLEQEETFEILKDAGISAVGAGEQEQQQRRPEIFEVKGQRIAYLGYDSADFAQGEGEAVSTAKLNKQKITEDIRAIRNQVDWVIVNYHWGEAVAEYPAQWQQDLAHLTIDQGADMVVGYHPYVLQGAEIYKGRPIAYSLGNFIFGGSSIRDCDTAVLKVSLKGKKMKVEFVPVEVRQYQPQVVKGEAGETILNDLARLSQEFERPMRFPMVLNTQRETAAPATFTSVSPTPAHSGSRSLIQMPVFPHDVIERHYLKPEELETDQLNDPTTQDDPFINQPFILQPTDTHSALPVAPSFNLSDSRRAKFMKKAVAAGNIQHHQALKLPVFG